MKEPEKFYAITGQRIIMIGARQEAIYWQNEAANEYRLARRAMDQGNKRKAVLYQVAAAHSFDAYLQEMQRIEQ